MVRTSNKRDFVAGGHSARTLSHPFARWSKDRTLSPSLPRIENWAGPACFAASFCPLAPERGDALMGDRREAVTCASLVKPTPRVAHGKAPGRQMATSTRLTLSVAHGREGQDGDVVL